MSTDLDIGQIINDSLNQLIRKSESDSLKNEDFTKTWTDIVMLPLFRIEFIIRSSSHTQKGYNRDEAVIYGFFMRLYKNLCFQRRLACNRLLTVELAGHFERMILEDNINLQFFVLNYGDSKLLNNFRVHSLKPEAKFEGIINDDILNHGGVPSPLQTRLINSIHNTYDKTGISSEKAREKIKMPTIFDKFRDTGNERLYHIVYRTKCHGIHGDWVDTVKNYLAYDHSSNTFSPNFHDIEADIRQLNPAMIICCDTIIKFINEIPNHGIPKDLCKEIAEDQRLIGIFDEMHENFINERDLLEGIDLEDFYNAGS